MSFSIVMILLISCEFFFQTPFPEELIYFNNSTDVEGIGAFDYTELYTIDDYVFLYVDEKDDDNKLYIYSSDLEFIHMEHLYSRCDTFAMRDAAGDYFVGNSLYQLNGTEWLGTFSEPDYGGTYPGESPPHGYGFSYNGYNYILWWYDYDNNLAYNRYSSVWDSPTSYTVSLNMFDYLEAVYYDENLDNPAESNVILFFSGGWDDVSVMTVPVYFFEDTFASHPEFDPSSDEYVIELDDIDAKEYYYADDGLIIYEHRGRYLRYTMDGEQKKVYSSHNEGYSEAYTLDGKTRYIFSERYMKLMKAGVWW
jgi:hypothetical protein